MKRAVGAAAAFVLATILLTAPAGAQITDARVDSPAAASQHGGNVVSVTGNFTVDDGSRRVGAKFTSRRDPGYSQTVAQDLDGGGGYGMSSPPLAWNGTYDLSVEFLNVDPDRGIFDSGCTCRTFVNRAIDLLVPPAVPGNVAGSFDAQSRSVRVTWAPNGEPDLLGYIVSRKIGNGAPQDIWDVHVPEPPEYVDSDLPNGAVQITYFITAIRKAVLDGDFVASGAGQSAAVAVPKAPPTTSTTGPGGPTTTKPSTTPTTRRGFGTPVTAPPASTTSTTRASRNAPPAAGTGFAGGLNGPTDRSGTTIDGGFEQTLPFQRRDDYDPDEDLELEEEGDPAAVSSVEDDEDNPTQALGFVGAAMNMGVWAALAFWIRAQVRKDEDDTDAEVLPVSGFEAPAVQAPEDTKAEDAPKPKVVVKRRPLVADRPPPPRPTLVVRRDRPLRARPL